MMSRGSVFPFLPLLRFFSGEREKRKLAPAPVLVGFFFSLYFIYFFSENTFVREMVFEGLAKTAFFSASRRKNYNILFSAFSKILSDH
jgi:hypothetical protein